MTRPDAGYADANPVAGVCDVCDPKFHGEKPTSAELEQAAMPNAKACACCGYINIFEEWDGGDVCDWVHDAVQERDPDPHVGANGLR